MKTLQHQLKNIKESSENNDEINKKLDQLIESQKRIIEYINDINDLVGVICLVELLSFGLMLVALLFLMNLVRCLRIHLIFLNFSSSGHVWVHSVLYGFCLYLHDSLPNFRTLLAFK
jgi:hypothetical protein